MRGDRDRLVVGGGDLRLGGGGGEKLLGGVRLLLYGVSLDRNDGLLERRRGGERLRIRLDARMVGGTHVSRPAGREERNGGGGDLERLT